jgi:SAM-dependent methyltransferase
VTADDAALTGLAHSGLVWNTPLSSEHAERLLQRLDLASAVRMLDLGCGWGELLLRALVEAPTARAVGVDTAVQHLRRGEAAAAARGLAGRVSFVAANLATYEGQADRVLCIGASHGWGDTSAALARLQQHVSPGGRLLLGDAYWVRPPEADVVAILGPQCGTLADLVHLAVGAGWRPLHVDVADAAEWDDFEFAWCGGLERFALAQPDHRLAGAAREFADRRRDEYLQGYRGVLGFAYLVLAKP